MINNKTLAFAGDKLREPGLWQRLFSHDVRPYEATIYGRSVESGGVVLTVRVPETEVAKATSMTSILNAHQAFDLRNWAIQQGLISEASVPKATALAASATMAAGSAVIGEEVIPLAEEHINVGKRLVRDGTTRIRRFVTETPVEKQVTLHEEHARVLRRATTDPNFVQDLDWTDKTVEVMETVEEPVITKSVHIAEGSGHSEGRVRSRGDAEGQGAPPAN